MLKKTLRKIIVMMTMVSTCVIFAACGQVGETGNQVANTTEAAITTAKSKDEIITEESKITATTTVTTTAEPETTTEATTTEAVTTTAEPESDNSDKVFVVPGNSNADTISGDDNKESTEDMYPMEECIRKIIRDEMGEEIVSFEDAGSQYQGVMYFANTEDGERVSISCLIKNIRNDFESGELTSIDRFALGEIEIDGVTYKDLMYIPKM